MVLGCIMNNVELLKSDKYFLDRDDFSPSKFHQILFAVIDNLADNDIVEIDKMAIDRFAQNYPKQYEVLIQNDFLVFVDNCKKIANQNLFALYYNNLKKMSLLRVYKKQGRDISQFYDEVIDNIKNLDNYTVEQIINHFEAQDYDIRKRFIKNVNVREYQAGTNFAETKERLKESPLMGSSFQSPYLNTIFRGAMGLILRAGKSGAGKSVLSLGDLCQMTVTEYWDYKSQSFIKNKSREGSSLFINTEMDLETGLDIIIISWISGVERGKILDGKYAKDEEYRIDRAREILLESELYIVDDPSFTIDSLISEIKDYVYNKQVKNVCFDYIQDNGIVSGKLANETKIPQRQDMVLLTLTDRLKQVQRECDINIITGCQTNNEEDKMPFPTESCLAGGKSQVRKTDGTMVMLPPKQKELDIFEELMIDGKLDTKNRPNNIIHIIKGRSSAYPKYIKVFQYVDLGTGRSEDLLVLDKDNNPIKINKTYIEYD
jgi:replicative DNA helicase